MTLSSAFLDLKFPQNVFIILTVKTVSRYNKPAKFHLHSLPFEHKQNHRLRLWCQVTPSRHAHFLYCIKKLKRNFSASSACARMSCTCCAFKISITVALVCRKTGCAVGLTPTPYLCSVHDLCPTYVVLFHHYHSSPNEPARAFPDTNAAVQ